MKCSNKEKREVVSLLLKFTFGVRERVSSLLLARESRLLRSLKKFETDEKRFQ